MNIKKTTLVSCFVTKFYRLRYYVFLQHCNSSQPFIFRTEKVFVGNLPPTATRTVLRRHFSEYGKITDCVIMVNKDGSGRGFGFCEFEDPESVDRVIDAWDNHYINGQWVEVKRASPENALRKYVKSRRLNMVPCVEPCRR